MKTTTSSSDTDHASSPSATSPDEARFKRANRRQVEMIMLSLNQRLDVDHPVRAVWAFVEGLDLTELYGKIKAVKGKAGAVAWQARMGTVEAQGIYQARAGIAEFSNVGCRNRGLYQFAVRGLEKVKCETLWQVLAGVFQRGLNLRKLAAEGVIGG